MCDCADPLVMDNGMDLIDMMCNCYDSPLDAADDEPQYNFSELPNDALQQPHAPVMSLLPRLLP